ncbi:MAG: prepilin-type N-terminal cleavage/methylation domain-containing protein [Acidobacteria bacterium]|nr:prepilin-type N-terminal cleavage/methylation domain-containing protein [Acidobacteriota bacterium]
MRLKVYSIREKGFSLIEIMTALCIIGFGLLAVGQLLYVASGSSSLARSKSTAVLAAQNVMESLETLYSRNPSAPDMAVGNHGPRSIEVANPANGTILNRFHVSWVVENVPDPRPGKVLKARRVRAVVTPVRLDGSENNQVGLNKTLSVSALFSQKI